MSAPAVKEIYHCFRVDAPPERVLRALTEKDDLAGWWTKGLEHEGGVGSISTFRFSSGAFNRMKIIKAGPDRVEWFCVDGHDEWKGTHLIFELRIREKGTTICFSHFGFAEQTVYVGECSFHWAHYLMSLKELCEKGSGFPNEGP